MYVSSKPKARLRALALAGLLSTAPVASAVTAEGGFSLSAWLQQFLTSIFTTSSITEDVESCTCGGANPDCGSIHLPGG